MWEKLILICSHRRSGSTWLASVLGKASQARQIPYEPLWLKWHPESPYADQIRRWRSSGGWYLGWDADSPAAQEASRALRGHLIWLCEHYFGGPVGTLIIKEPHPNWLEFLLAAFQPDQVLYLQRHPLGIVNSYDKAGLYSRWHVEEEWQAFRRQVPDLAPDLVDACQALQHPAEQVACMAHVGTLLQGRLLAGQSSRLVDYEALGERPQRGFADLFGWMGLDWDSGTWDRLRPLIEPTGAEVETGFRFVRKRSQARLHAWRRELPRHLIARLQRMFQRLEADYPFPGAGLPPLSWEETLSGWTTYLRRRRAYGEQFGWRAALRSR